jgi:hypothetical protein
MKSVFAKCAFGIRFGLVLIGCLGAASAAHAQRISPALNCNDLHHEAADLNFRLDNSPDPLEHSRLARQLHVVHGEEDSCGP